MFKPRNIFKQAKRFVNPMLGVDPLTHRYQYTETIRTWQGVHDLLWGYLYNYSTELDEKTNRSLADFHTRLGEMLKRYGAQ